MSGLSEADRGITNEEKIRRLYNLFKYTKSVDNFGLDQYIAVQEAYRIFIGHPYMVFYLRPYFLIAHSLLEVFETKEPQYFGRPYGLDNKLEELQQRITPVPEKENLIEEELPVKEYYWYENLTSAQVNEIYHRFGRLPKLDFRIFGYPYDNRYLGETGFYSMEPDIIMDSNNKRSIAALHKLGKLLGFVKES